MDLRQLTLASTDLAVDESSSIGQGRLAKWWVEVRQNGNRGAGGVLPATRLECRD